MSSRSRVQPSPKARGGVPARHPDSLRSSPSATCDNRKVSLVDTHLTGFLLVEFPRPAEQGGAEHLGNLAGWREGVVWTPGCVGQPPYSMLQALSMYVLGSCISFAWQFSCARVSNPGTIFLGQVLIYGYGT